MKKIHIALIALMLLAVPQLRAQSAGNRTISVKDLELVQENDGIKISFTAKIGRKAAKSDYTLIVIPTLSKEKNSAEFPPIIIKGKRAQIAHERIAFASAKNNLPSFSHNGEKVNYEATIPFEAWMVGSDLTIEGISEGCCSTIKTRLGLIGSNMITPATSTLVEEAPQQHAVPVPQIVVEVPVMQQQEPELIAPAVQSEPYLWYSFIAPVQEYEDAAARSVTDLFGNPIPLRQGVAVHKEQQKELDMFIEKNRIGSLQVHFSQGKKVLERYFRDNASNLDMLAQAISDLENSPNHEIKRVVIAGFASPEGNARINLQLGWERGKAIERFVLENSKTIRPDMVDIYNGQVDWSGLREYVANSNIPDKYAVLNIIDNVPIWDPVKKTGRLGALMRLNGGSTYRYLYSNVFPDLRNATCIRIFYEEFDD